MEKVHVDKRLLVGLAGVAGASLLAVAFLLGKASSSGPEAGGTSPGRAASTDASTRERDATVPPGTQPAVPVDPAATAPPIAAEPAPALAPLPRVSPPDGVATPAAPAPHDGSQPAPDPARAAVAAYLEAVARIQPGQMGGDAEAAANGMATALANGDASGLEKLIRETEEARAKLTALSPPAECAAHYRESLGSLDDALEMLRGLKTAMDSPDPAASLAAVGTRATALRSRAEALQREEQALRERHHLPR